MRRNQKKKETEEEKNRNKKVVKRKWNGEKEGTGGVSGSPS